MPGAGSRERIKVICRFRPQSAREKERNGRLCFHADADAAGNRDGNVTLRTLDAGHHAFAFDAIFPPSASQEEIFDEVGAPLIESVLDGYNGTILAYGQTGGGKTYTMEGKPKTTAGKAADASSSEDLRGIIPRAVEHIFDKVSESQSRRDRRPSATPPPQGLSLSLSLSQ